MHTNFMYCLYFLHTFSTIWQSRCYHSPPKTWWCCDTKLSRGKFSSLCWCIGVLVYFSLLLSSLFRYLQSFFSLSRRQLQRKNFPEKLFSLKLFSALSVLWKLKRKLLCKLKFQNDCGFELFLLVSQKKITKNIFRKQLFLAHVKYFCVCLLVTWICQEI